MIFKSKEEFILDAIAWQMDKVFSILKDARSKCLSAKETRILYHKIFKQLHFANHEDMIYIKIKLKKKPKKSLKNSKYIIFKKL